MKTGLIKKLRYCKRCGEIFESKGKYGNRKGKYGRICPSCTIKPIGKDNKPQKNSMAYYLGVGFGNSKSVK